MPAHSQRSTSIHSDDGAADGFIASPTSRTPGTNSCYPTRTPLPSKPAPPQSSSRNTTRPPPQTPSNSLHTPFSRIPPSMPDLPPPVRVSGAQEFPSTSSSTRGRVSNARSHPHVSSVPIPRSPGSMSGIMAALDAVGSRLSLQWPKVGEAPRSSAEVSVQLERLLLWHDLWSTGRVLLGGIYFLMCLRQLLHGRSIQLHPWTMLCGCCLLLLLYNSLCSLWLKLRRGWYRARHNGEAPGPTLTRHTTPEMELQLQQDVTQGMVKTAQWVAPYFGAIAVLMRRALAGERAGATAWTGLSLWMLMLVSELQLLSTFGSALMLWIMLFTLPPLYIQSRHVMDSLVGELWDFFLWVFTDSRHRTSLLLAGGCGWVVVACMPGGLVLRLTLAAAAYAAVLAWRARALGTRPSTSCTQDSQAAAAHTGH